MISIISSKNNCIYTLDVNNRVLMYAPSNSSYYDWVEWDELDEDELIEANRCHKRLLSKV